MRYRILIITVLFFLATGLLPLSAETLVVKENSQATTGKNATVRPPSAFSLFDPARFHMSHAYSISYVSGGGYSQTIAAYINQMDYQFARPLRLSVGLAFLHQPQSWFGSGASSSLNGRVLPSFRLLWEPSRHFHMSIGYETYAPGVYYHNRYYSPYGRYESIFD